MNTDIIFLNNKAMEELGVLDIRQAISDVEQAYVLNANGDVISSGKRAKIRRGC